MSHASPDETVSTDDPVADDRFDYEQALAECGAELARLSAENERLRWRDPVTLPAYADLPVALRHNLVRIAGIHMRDGSETQIVLFYEAVREALRTDLARTKELLQEFGLPD